MGQYVKSISDAERITNGLMDLKDELKSQKEATKVNNRELQKLNEAAEIVRETKITKLENEIRQMKEDAKWVKGSKPALDLRPDNLMKKLNII